MTRAASSRRLQHLQSVLTRWRTEQCITGTSIHELMLECLLAVLIARRYVREDLLGIKDEELRNGGTNGRGMSKDEIQKLVAERLGVESKGQLAHKNGADDMVTLADKVTQAIIQRVLAVRYAQKAVDEDEWFVDEKGYVFHFKGLVEVARRIYPKEAGAVSNANSMATTASNIGVFDALPFTMIGEEEASTLVSNDDGRIFKSYTTKPEHRHLAEMDEKEVGKTLGATVSIAFHGAAEEEDENAKTKVKKGSHPSEKVIAKAIDKCIHTYLPNLLEKLTVANSDNAESIAEGAASARAMIKGKLGLLLGGDNPTMQSQNTILSPEERADINRIAHQMLYNKDSVYSYVEDVEKSCGATKRLLELQHRRTLTAHLVGKKLRADRTKAREQLYLDIARVAGLVDADREAQDDDNDEYGTFVVEDAIEQHIPFFYKFNASINETLQNARTAALQPALPNGDIKANGEIITAAERSLWGYDPYDGATVAGQASVAISDGFASARRIDGAATSRRADGFVSFRRDNSFKGPQGFASARGFNNRGQTTARGGPLTSRGSFRTAREPSVILSDHNGSYMSGGEEKGGLGNRTSSLGGPMMTARRRDSKAPPHETSRHRSSSENASTANVSGGGVYVPVSHNPTLKETLANIISFENPLTIFALPDHKKLVRVAVENAPFRRMYFKDTAVKEGGLDRKLHDDHFAARIVSRSNSNTSGAVSRAHSTMSAANLNASGIFDPKAKRGAINKSALASSAIPTVIVYEDAYDDGHSVSEAFREGKGDLNLLVSDDEEERINPNDLGERERKEYDSVQKKLAQARTARIQKVSKDRNLELKEELRKHQSAARRRERAAKREWARENRKKTNRKQNSSSEESESESESDSEWDMTPAEIQKKRFQEEVRSKARRERDLVARFATHYFMHAPQEAAEMATKKPHKLLQALAIHLSHAAQRQMIKKRIAILIDPIDGTNALTQGDRHTPMTLVGISVDGEAVVGLANRIMTEDDGKAAERVRSAQEEFYTIPDPAKSGIFGGGGLSIPFTAFTDNAKGTSDAGHHEYDDKHSVDAETISQAGHRAMMADFGDTESFGGPLPRPDADTSDHEMDPAEKKRPVISRLQLGSTSVSSPTGFSLDFSKTGKGAGSSNHDGFSAFVELDPSEVPGSRATETMFAIPKSWKYAAADEEGREQSKAPVHPLSYCMFAFDGLIAHSVIDGEWVDTKAALLLQQNQLQRLEDEEEKDKDGEVASSSVTAKSTLNANSFVNRVQLVNTLSSTTNSHSLEQVTHLVKPFTPVLERGAGNKLLLVAKGYADIMSAPPVTIHKWDTCAPHAFIRCVGGDLFDTNGRPLMYPALEYDDSSLLQEFRRADSMATKNLLRATSMMNPTSCNGNNTNNTNLNNSFNAPSPKRQGTGFFTSRKAYNSDNEDGGERSSMGGRRNTTVKLEVPGEKSTAAGGVNRTHSMLCANTNNLQRRASLANLTGTTAADVWELTELPNGIIACHNLFVKQIVMKRLTALGHIPVGGHGSQSPDKNASILVKHNNSNNNDGGNFSATRNRFNHEDIPFGGASPSPRRGGSFKRSDSIKSARSDRSDNNEPIAGLQKGDRKLTKGQLIEKERNKKDDGCCVVM